MSEINILARRASCLGSGTALSQALAARRGFRRGLVGKLVVKLVDVREGVPQSHGSLGRSNAGCRIRASLSRGV